MRCHVCGGPLDPTVTDMPFKTGAKSIVILRELPVLQCGSRGEYLIEDAVMVRADTMLAEADERAEKVYPSAA